MSERQGSVISFFEKDIHPFYQAGFIIVVMLVFDLVSSGLRASGMMDVKDNFPWQVVLSFMLFYALFNSLLGLGAKDGNKYYLYSMIGFVALAAAGGFLAFWFSGISIEQAPGAIKWIYFVFAFGYLVFVSIVQLMKKIVQLAQEQDKKLRGEE